MNDSDTAEIVPRDVTDERTPDGGPTEEPEAPRPRFPPVNGKCSAVTVEPVIFLAMFSVAMNGPLSTQYLWDRVSEDVGYNGSKTSECSNGSIPPDPLQKVSPSCPRVCEGTS